MKIKKIVLENYRGAHSLSLPLNKRLNVFYGVNGSGKSTILDAIAIMLSWSVSRIRHAGSSGRPIAETDITNGRSVAQIKLVIKDEKRKISWGS